MAHPTRDTLFKTAPPRAQTIMDRISRAAMQIVDEESKQRETKTQRLREARLERERSGAGKGIASPKRARTQTR